MDYSSARVRNNSTVDLSVRDDGMRISFPGYFSQTSIFFWLYFVYMEFCIFPAVLLSSIDRKLKRRHILPLHDLVNCRRIIADESMEKGPLCRFTRTKSVPSTISRVQGLLAIRGRDGPLLVPSIKTYLKALFQRLNLEDCITLGI